MLLNHQQIQNFRQKFVERDEDECWYWTGAIGKHGYGVVGFNGKTYLAHRVAWMIANAAEIPEDLEILHSCDCRPCVNFFHLRPGTHQENVNDATERDRWRSSTHCPQGHEYTAANTYISPRRDRNPDRQCRACRRERKKNGRKTANY